MNYNKKTVYDIDVAGKKVLLRCDFNVPQDKATGAITSDKRIVAALPTIRYLLGQGAAVIACSHLGKPEPSFEKWVKKQAEKGKDPAELTEEKWQKSLKKLTLAPVAERLSELLGKPVVFAHDVVGPDAKAKAAALKGGEIGKSLLEEDKCAYALEMIEKAKAKGVKLLLPVDTVAAKEFAADAEPVVVDAMHIPADMMGMDIGPKTIELFCAATRGAGTIVWNGPMGVFEFPAFANGTKAMAKALAESGAVTIIGGGDSAAAAEQLGFADKITHISTGGGASLEFLEGKELPGVACLLDK